jgi:phage recombination protein Bet
MATPNGEREALILPEPVARRGITEPQWRTLMNSLYPGAKSASVLLVWDYCIARKLDPLKKPCHIVPMEVKVGDKYEWRDVVMPGIYELRTTAQRTGYYLGHPKPEYGPFLDYAGVSAPEWCEFTAYRWNPEAGQRAEFPVRTFFREVVATKRDGKANARWSKAPIQMLVKCAEAAALREAFPDEIGGQQTAEEMDGQRAADAPAVVVSPIPKPEGYDDWITDLTACADEGLDALERAWKQAKKAYRDYLAISEPDGWDLLKAKATQADAKKRGQPAPTDEELAF